MGVTMATINRVLSYCAYFAHYSITRYLDHTQPTVTSGIGVLAVGRVLGFKVLLTVITRY